MTNFQIPLDSKVGINCFLMEMKNINTQTSLLILFSNLAVEFFTKGGKSLWGLVMLAS